MMMSWYGNSFFIIGLCDRDPLVAGGFPHKGPVMWSFDFFLKILTESYTVYWIYSKQITIYQHIKAAGCIYVSLI